MEDKIKKLEEENKKLEEFKCRFLDIAYILYSNGDTLDNLLDRMYGDIITYRLVVNKLKEELKIRKQINENK